MAIEPNSFSGLRHLCKVAKIVNEKMKNKRRESKLLGRATPELKCFIMAKLKSNSPFLFIFIIFIKANKTLNLFLAMPETAQARSEPPLYEQGQTYFEYMQSCVAAEYMPKWPRRGESWRNIYQNR